MSRNEAKTRKDLIDPALTTAEWNLEDRDQVKFEIPVDGYDAAPWSGVTDYWGLSSDTAQSRMI